MSVDDADLDSGSPPSDIARRITTQNATGEAETPVSGTLIGNSHNPTGYVDVANHDWGDVVGLITTVEAEDGQVVTSMELSPERARKLAWMLERQADEIEAAAEMEEE